MLATLSVLAILTLRLPPVSGQSGISTADASGAGRRSESLDPPCFDNDHRYADCRNGTVTDSATGLVWLKDAGCLGSLDWAAANRAAARLRQGRCRLSDGSKPGDWRLPTNAEWNATVATARNHPLLLCTSPALTDDSGAACFGTGSGSSFTNVALDGYWSSTTSSQAAGLLPDGTKAGTLTLANGLLLSFFDKSCCPQRVWPVRAH
jgi:hypothetical protein